MSLPGRRIQRKRDCQPRTVLTESYWKLLTNAIHGLNCVSPTSLYSRVLNAPSGKSIEFHSAVGSEGVRLVEFFGECTAVIGGLRCDREDEERAGAQHES